ncbi:MAG: hypothetical protein ACP5UD_08410 [Conexivisphaera sp.]
MAPVVNGYNRGILNRRVVRAAVIEEFGRDLRIEDVEMEAGPGEVPVEVRASGICGRDLVVWRGGFRNLKASTHTGARGVRGAGWKAGRRVRGHHVRDVQVLQEREGEPMREPDIPRGGAPGRVRGERVNVPHGNMFDLPDSDYPRYAAAACPLATAIRSSKIARIGKGGGRGTGLGTIR